jgi:hypothetical protein
MTMQTANKACVMCGRGPQDTPVLRLEFRDTAFWICPQHLPVLIHDPSQLVGRLAGAESLKPSDFHDDDAR